jgi:chromosome segregation ATPase
MATFFRCPTCGLLKSTKTYEPTNFDNDISLVYMSSLGRGKGFQIIGEASIEDDSETLMLIKQRIATLHNYLNGPEINEIDKLAGTVEELKEELCTCKKDLKAANKQVTELESVLGEHGDSEEELVDLIVDALGDATKIVFEDLESAVEALIEVYHDLREEYDDLT